MKNNEKLLYMIGEVNDKAVPDMPEKKPNTLWMKLSAVGCGAAAAALLGIVILGGGGGEQPPHGGYTSEPVTNYDPQQTPDISEGGGTDTEAVTTVGEGPMPVIYPSFVYRFEDKELVPFSANITDRKGAGFEGYSSYGQELFEYRLSKNPWNESMELETLPVFRNAALAPFSTFELFSKDELRVMAVNAASALGTEIDSADPVFSEMEGADPIKPHMLAAVCMDGTEIRVYGNGNISIVFDPAVPLPEGCGTDTPEKKREAMEYIAKEYRLLLGFENPDIFFDSEITDSILVYDNSGGDVQKILNYNLFYARFLLDDNGGIGSIIISNGFCAAEYMGDYPVITLTEAKEMLLSGKYLANVFESYISGGAISEEDIAAVELVYRYSGGYEEYFQPSYCFYVVADMGEGFEEHYPGVTNYAALYVPAVTEEYIGGMTEWYSPDSD